MLRALEQIRRMRGGAQSHLMRCSDGHYYVVKFQNNPQHRRVLVNELLGTRLAARLGLPTTPVAVLEVSEELIRYTPELCVELPRARTPCVAGLQFGSRFPGDPRRLALYDFLPDEQLREVANLHDFAGMLVFDKWTCNTNGRQTLFYARDAERETEQLARKDSPLPVRVPARGASAAVRAEFGEAGEPERTGQVIYKTKMIDQGFCFNAGEWNFPDAPLRGLYARNRVYQGVIGMESFAPWLQRLERMGEVALDEIGREIPSQWYADDYDALMRLLEQIYRRRHRLPDLILQSKKSNRQPFPNWV
jgi:hypothetical protein